MAKQVFVGVCPAGGKHAVAQSEVHPDSAGGQTQLKGRCGKCEGDVHVPLTSVLPQFDDDDDSKT